MNARTDPTLGPGIHSIPAAAYHADPCETPSLSNSLMTTLLQKTPLHAWLDHPRLNPKYKREAGEPKFDIGTAAHSVFLEGADVVEIIDAPDWRTNDAKQMRADAYALGKIPLLPPQARALTAMVKAAHDYIATTALAGVLERGKPEQTLIWKDKGGVICRARPDFLTDEYSLILDYKTTGVETPAQWVRNQMLAHGYDTQAQFYPRGVEALGHRRPRFIFLVQEDFAPYFCYLVEPAESMAELANHKIARALPLWRECLATNRWPGYLTDVHQAEAPVWALKEEELA